MNSSEYDSDLPEETLDHLDGLLSCYFDDELDDQSLEEMNEILRSDPEARKRYIATVQLHTDLTEFYRSKSKAKKTSIAPLNLPTSFDGPAVESR